MKRFPIHTILLTLYPILFLYSNNFAETSITETIRPTSILLAISGSLWVTMSLLLKDKVKSGLILSLFFILTFLYGPLRDLITPLEWSHPQRYLFAAETFCFVLFLIFVLRRLKQAESVNFIFNIAALLLVSSSLITAFSIYLTGQDADSFENIEIVSVTDLEIPADRPDIYYLITDGYGRSDVLQKLYGYDNSKFIDYLKNKQFFVADKSLSNYSQTALSLPSSLNMTYLDEVASLMGASSANVIPLVNMIKNNEIMKLFKNIGYTTIAFSTGYWDTELKNSDLFLSPGQLILTDFESLLLDMTPVAKILSKNYSYHYDSRRRILSSTLNNLGNLPPTEKPKFVFAHIPAPHEPYVYDKNGNETEPPGSVMNFDENDNLFFKEKNQRYSDYVEWLNGRLMSVINQILKDTTKSSVIILQADHGSNSYLMQGDSSQIGLVEKQAILNAYFFPDTDYENLYDNISPVNSFRVLLNHCFGAKLDLLEDRSYFSRFDRPYDLFDVTAKIKIPLPENIPEPAINRLRQ